MNANPRLEAIRAGLGARPIVFVGMMGSGKTAVGKLVASELGLPFHDSDNEIVEAAGMTIPEIFERFGEDYFRAGERRVIARLLAEGPGVLSLGGGAFISPETREEIRRHGVSVWLVADPDLLLSRVMNRPKTRPLLQTADPRATLVDLLEKRTPIYRLADIHVESSRASKRQTCDAVVEQLERWLDNNATAEEKSA